ncbi:hypothetical protein P7K49_016134 [Saguinus oedipus]|uniref:Uncharacterized protein n=1 Tax=Saguinus oedipus TaxID=9490 RepID=A0ABQ9VC09_SAGOE|nr:hypothetical protein P7K49_016134 [Saguinus oedipus]
MDQIGYLKCNLQWEAVSKQEFRLRHLAEGNSLRDVQLCSWSSQRQVLEQHTARGSLGVERVGLLPSDSPPPLVNSVARWEG